MAGKLEGKTAIVTGCASPRGLGFSIARLFHDQGANVILSDIDAEGVSDRAREIGVGGATAIGLRHDVSSETDWALIVDRAVAEFGALDVAVNNAGISRRAEIHKFELNRWEEVLAVNQTGTFLGCKHAIAVMAEGGRGGVIVNIASIAGRLGVPLSGAYGASKAAILQLSRIIAVEAAKNHIRCNAILPGMIASDIHTPIQEQSPDQHAALVAAIPMARMGEPDDIAKAALFLACEDSSYITGAEILVDGGLSAR